MKQKRPAVQAKDEDAQKASVKPAEEKAKKKRTKMHEHTAENDIRYRGPINFQGFQLLGWACIVFTVVVAVIQLGGKFDPGVTKEYGSIANVLQYLSILSLPFLLLANFAKILGNFNGYKKQLLITGGAAAGIFAATLLFGGRYFIGFLQQLVVQKDEVVPLLTELFRAVMPEGYFAFNLFIDLFMCTLTMFFLNVRPKRVFTGKKVLFLRVLVVLPIAYEAACLWLKIQSIRGLITLPLWSFPLLTVKPPVAIVMFIFIAFLVKFREYRFCRHGRTHEEYQEFMQSNRNSLHLSVRLCVSMIVFALIDFILVILVAYLQADAMGAVSAELEIADEAMATAIHLPIALGIGETLPMILVAPLMLLFSYNKAPKRPIISILIPAVSIVLMLVIVLEAARLGIGMLMEGKQIDLDQLALLFQEGGQLDPDTILLMLMSVQ